MWTLVAMSCAIAGGCSFAPGATALETANLGPELAQADAERQAKGSLEEWLWYSTRVQWLEFGRAWRWNGVLGGGHEYGHALTMTINEQHPEVGYLGEREYYFFFKDGAVLAHDRIGAGRPWGFIDQSVASGRTAQDSTVILVPDSPRSARYGPNGIWR